MTVDVGHNPDLDALLGALFAWACVAVAGALAVSGLVRKRS